jgi:NADPH2:quinone reductase
MPAPQGVDLVTAGALPEVACTVWSNVFMVAGLQPDETLLVHGGAGGIGTFAIQLAHALGARVVTTAGSAAKLEVCRSLGADVTVNYREQDFVEEVKKFTGGKLCEVVYDSVGKDTFEGSLNCLKPIGLLALFGASSGPVPPFNLGVLAQKGSLYITRPTLFTYVASRADLVQSANALFDVVKSGVVKVEVKQHYKLADVAKAHRDLEGRKTTGVTVLVP